MLRRSADKTTVLQQHREVLSASAAPPCQGTRVHTARKFTQTYCNKVVSIPSVRLLSNILTACYSCTLFTLLENNTALSTTITQFTRAISINLSHLWLLESRQTMSSDLSDVPRVTKNVAPEKKWFSILTQRLGRNIQVSKRIIYFYLPHLIH